MKQWLLAMALMTGTMTGAAQTHYDHGQMQTERLGRGVVAYRSGTTVIVSWRTLPTDKAREPFDVYRNGVRLNAKPLTEGGTCFVDKTPPAGGATYAVRGGGHDGTFTLAADAPDGYLRIPLTPPVTADSMALWPRRQVARRPTQGGTAPDTAPQRLRMVPVTYHANDATVADVDGDGEYEIILKWEPSNAHDNSQAGQTSAVYVDCYRLDGTRL